jgi:hypothetical protein
VYPRVKEKVGIFAALCSGGAQGRKIGGHPFLRSGQLFVTLTLRTVAPLTLTLLRESSEQRAMRGAMRGINLKI